MFYRSQKRRKKKEKGGFTQLISYTVRREKEREGGGGKEKALPMKNNLSAMKGKEKREEAAHALNSYFSALSQKEGGKGEKSPLWQRGRKESDLARGKEKWSPPPSRRSLKGKERGRGGLEYLSSSAREGGGKKKKKRVRPNSPISGRGGEKGKRSFPDLSSPPSRKRKEKESSSINRPFEG